MPNKKCYYETNIDYTNILNNEFVLPIVNNTKRYLWQYPVNKILDRTWVNYISGLGLDPVFIMLFYKSENQNDSHAHIDGGGERFGLNLQLSGIGSEMIWYDQPDIESEVQSTVINTPYVSWPISQLIERNRGQLPIGKISIVRVDIPHAIKVLNESRWCISMRCKQKFNTWDDTVEYLSNKGLLNQNS